jgi:hypothetical protein
MFGLACSAKQYPRAPITKPFMAKAAAKAVILVERVFMCVSVSQWLSFVDGRILSAILQVLTRYSANDRRFPVNDRSLFTVKKRRSRRHPGGWLGSQRGLDAEVLRSG